MSTYYVQKVDGLVSYLLGSYLKMDMGITAILNSSNLVTLYQGENWDYPTDQKILIFEPSASIEVEFVATQDGEHAFRVMNFFKAEVVSVSLGDPRVIRASNIAYNTAIGTLASLGSNAVAGDVLYAGDMLYLSNTENQTITIKLSNLLEGEENFQMHDGPRRDEMPGLEEGMNQVNAFGVIGGGSRRLRKPGPSGTLWPRRG